MKIIIRNIIKERKKKRKRIKKELEKLKNLFENNKFGEYNKKDE